MRSSSVDSNIGNASAHNITGSHSSIAPGNVVGDDVSTSGSKKEGNGSESHDERSLACVKERLAKKVVLPDEVNEGMRMNEQV
jgi:hypothetical protein